MGKQDMDSPNWEHLDAHLKKKVRRNNDPLKYFVWPDVSDPAGAQNAINLGVLAAAIVAGLTAFSAILSNPWSLVDAGLFGLTAWGIRKQMRVAAVLGLALYLLETLPGWIQSGFRPAFGLIVWAGFVQAFISAIRGSFAMHRFQREAAGELPT